MACTSRDTLYVTLSYSWTSPSSVDGLFKLMIVLRLSICMLEIIEVTQGIRGVRQLSMDIRADCTLRLQHSL